jgi:peptidoglycan hydrolase-like protein with peptidoglycan-binding domain
MVRQAITAATGLALLASLVGGVAFAGAALTPVPAAAQFTEGPCDLSAGSHPALETGSTGEAVLHAQCLLNTFGFEIAEDGVFGRQTRGAVATVQADNNLAIDGVVGRCTWHALHRDAIPVECLDF